MSRLFTFGCSFTNYRWSTWADCLAPEFDEFYNWGQSGAGNHFIFNSVMEADQRYKFGAGDTVVVCWTNVMREDRYTDRWQTLGNISTCDIYRKEYVVEAITERGCLIRDLAMIKATQHLLHSRSGLRTKFLAICPLAHIDQFSNNQVDHKDIFEVYGPILNSILPSYQQVLYSAGWKNSDDPHPTPAEHLSYLDTVLPGWVTKPETRVIMHEESVNLNKDPHKSGMSKVTRL